MIPSHRNTLDLCKPHRVEGLPPVRSAVCGDQFVLCVGRDSTVWFFYQWGYPPRSQHPPFLVEGVTASQVACGEEHALFVGEDGKVYGYGSSFHGSLGNSPQATRTGPRSREAFYIPLPFEVQSVHCGSYFSVIRAVDG